MFQGLSQGSFIHILKRNEPRVEKGRVLSINTHLPQYNPSQPQAMFGGMVTDITVSVGDETIPFIGLPATASVANFPDKGLYISEDQGMIVTELTSMRDNSQRIVDSYEANKELRDKCDEILISLNPERQKEAQSAREMAELKSELADMKRMISAMLGNKSKEE